MTAPSEGTCTQSSIILGVKVGHCAQALIESIFICGGGSAVPGVGPRLLQDICAHLLPSMQPVLCPLPEYLPEHAGSADLPQLHACSRVY